MPGLGHRQDIPPEIEGVGSLVDDVGTWVLGEDNLEQQEAGFVPFGTDFVNPDFSQVATALGARGIRVEEPGDVRDALRAALAHTGGPVVVDVVVDRTRACSTASLR